MTQIPTKCVLAMSVHKQINFFVAYSGSFVWSEAFFSREKCAGKDLFLDPKQTVMQERLNGQKGSSIPQLQHHVLFYVIILEQSHMNGIVWNRHWKCLFLMVSVNSFILVHEKQNFTRSISKGVVLPRVVETDCLLIKHETNGLCMRTYALRI